MHGKVYLVMTFPRHIVRVTNKFRRSFLLCTITHVVGTRFVRYRFPLNLTSCPIQLLLYISTVNSGITGYYLEGKVSLIETSLSDSTGLIPHAMYKLVSEKYKNEGSKSREGHNSVSMTTWLSHGLPG